VVGGSCSVGHMATEIVYPYLFTDWAGETHTPDITMVTVRTREAAVLDQAMRSWWNSVRITLKQLSQTFDYLATAICPVFAPDHAEYAAVLAAQFKLAAADGECHTKHIARALEMAGADHYPHPFECTPHPQHEWCRPRPEGRNDKFIERCARRPFAHLVGVAGGHAARQEQLRGPAPKRIDSAHLARWTNERELSRELGFVASRPNPPALPNEVLGLFRALAFGEVPSSGSATNKLLSDALRRMGATRPGLGDALAEVRAHGSSEGSVLAWDGRAETSLAAIVDYLLHKVWRGILRLSDDVTTASAGANGAGLRLAILEITQQAHRSSESVPLGDERTQAQLSDAVRAGGAAPSRWKELLPSILARHLYGALAADETATVCVDGSLDSAARVRGMVNERWREDAAAKTRAAVSGLVPVNSNGAPGIWLSDIVAFSVRNLNGLLRDPASAHSLSTVFTRLGHDFAVRQSWLPPRGPQAVRLRAADEAAIAGTHDCPYCSDLHPLGSAIRPLDQTLTAYLATPWPRATLYAEA